MARLSPLTMRAALFPVPILLPFAFLLLPYFRLC